MNDRMVKELGYDIPYPVMLSGNGLKGLLEGILKKLEEAFTKGMKDLHLTILKHNSKELTDYIAYNDELFGKLLKEIRFIK